jgi:glycosyltransferase involved in cell wall biosynthesis
MVNYERRLRSEDRRLGVDDRIIWAGQLDSQQMGWCYQNCFAFVMTSRAEACPNTALEALSYGCRIISTTKDPMPEFFIDNARYYVPRSASDLAKQILEAMTVPDETGRPPYADALQRASFFRWSDTASQAVEQMQLCVDGDRK